MPDSRHSANAVPTWIPAAPADLAASSAPALACPPASQNGSPSPGHFGQIDGVARPVHRFARRVQVQWPARRCAVPACDRGFQDVAVRCGERVAGQVRGQDCGGDDREERGSGQRRWRGTAQPGGVEADGVALRGEGASHGDGQLSRLAAGQAIQQSRYLGGNARAHQHVVHAGEHRPERGGRAWRAESSPDS